FHGSVAEGASGRRRRRGTPRRSGRRRRRHLLPLKDEDAALALQLGRALDDVAKGAQAGVNLDASAPLRSPGGPPAPTLPGTNCAVAAVFSLFQWGALRETEIHAVLSNEKDARGRDVYRMRLQVDGPNLSMHAIETDAEVTSEQAYLDGAALRSARARRGRVLPLQPGSQPGPRRRGAGSSPRIVAHGRFRVAAFHVWGLVLRHDGDSDGAREKLQLALDENEHLSAA